MVPVYSIAEAKDSLSKLVDEVLAGDDVTITRHGKPVVDLLPAKPSGSGYPSAQLLDEIAERAKNLPALGESATDVIRQMRDDYP